MHTRKEQRKSPLTYYYPQTSGGLLAVLVEGADAYHYSFVVQTNSGSRVNLYWSLLWTYSGPHVDQYWSPRWPILGYYSA